ncbi:MAG TPA: hypothetical protein DHU89_07065 [Flavobacteriales bacterium]|nr:hypothetical protein [Flavobacteriales bacterium]
MSTITDLSKQINLREDELRIPQPIMERFHPIAWLQSLGQFLNQESHETSNLSLEGMKSVRLEIIEFLF